MVTATLEQTREILSPEVTIDPRLTDNRAMQASLGTEQNRRHLEHSLAESDTIKVSTDNSSETGQSAWKSVQGAAQWVAEGTKSNAKWVVNANDALNGFMAERVGNMVGSFEAGRRKAKMNQGSMGQTAVAAYQARPQPAAANQQQSGFSQRQTNAPVAGKGSIADGLAKVAALSAIGTTMVVGAAAAAPLVLAAAPAVAMAYMAIKAAEALMNFFKGGKQQGQPRATSGQQQQQPGQAQAQAPAAQATAQASAQGEQQPTDQQLAIPGLESTSNANGASTGIQFTQDVDLGSMKAPAPGFNLDAVMGALSARGDR